MRLTFTSVSPAGLLAAGKASLMPGLIATSGICALSVGRPILLPLGMAALFALLLFPAVTALRKFGIRHRPAVMICALLASVMVGALGFVISSQIAALRLLVPDLHLAGASIPLFAALNTPLPVWVAGTVAHSMANPICPIGIGFLFTTLILLTQDDLPTRIVRFVVVAEASRTEIALRASARCLGRHFVRQMALDGCFGALIAIGLCGLDVPNPGLWALLAALLRSIPFVGVPLAAACPLMLVAATDQTGWLVCWSAILYLTADLTIRVSQQRITAANTPRLTGAAAFASVLAWTALWGPVGMLLAAPLTLSIVILGRHFDTFHLLDALLVQTENHGIYKNTDAAVMVPNCNSRTARQDVTAGALLRTRRGMRVAATVSKNRERLLALFSKAVCDLHELPSLAGLLPLRLRNVALGLFQSDPESRRSWRRGQCFSNPPLACAHTKRFAEPEFD